MIYPTNLHRKVRFTKKVRSSDGSKYYTVAVYGPRTATCTCIGYHFAGHCKHQRRVLEGVAA